jgi:hypothetical protein
MAICSDPFAIIRYGIVGRYGRTRIQFERFASGIAALLSDDSGDKIVRSNFLLYLLA